MMRTSWQTMAARSCLAVSLSGCLMLGGCSVGPKYARPGITTPPAFKELTLADFKETDGWKIAQPQDDALRGKWWEIFQDPQLNALVEQVNVSNQNIAAATANFLAARALVLQARSRYFPSVTTNPSITNSRPSSGQFPSGISISSSANYSLPFDASWEPDFWGRVRNTTRATITAAQARAADLENVRLAAQAEVATNYFAIRAQDSVKQLFDTTVAAYQDSLDITRVRFQAGIASEEEVAQAQTQLLATQARATDLGILRAQLEHAIALLTGQPASTFPLPVQALAANPPAVPLGLPSQLLERRPDVAAAERAMAQANAQIGLAQAAFYPNITLNAAAGFGTREIANWFSWPSRFWSVGPNLAQSIFDAGLRRATVQQYQAIYDEAVANYRQTVLKAFQEVEDNLAALRILSTEIRQQDAAVDSAGRSLQIAAERYRAGIDPYLNIITAQTILLNNQETAVNLRKQQITASVQLIKALGGGWDAAQMPSENELSGKFPPRAETTP